jgi:hypothetical protein
MVVWFTAIASYFQSWIVIFEINVILDLWELFLLIEKDFIYKLHLTVNL